MTGVQSAAHDVDVDLRALFSGLGRNWPRIVIGCIIVTGLAAAFAWLATPLYRAETRILIESGESVFTRPESANADSPSLDQEGVASQVQVVGSTDILRKVAHKLDLASRTEFNPGAHLGPLDRALVSTGLENDPREIPVDERVLAAMRERLTVYRVDNSRVIVIGFSSKDPKLAAEVPNAIADAYIAVERAAKLELNTDATAWLQPEIADLTKRVKQAEAKVADFRAHSDLLLGDNNSTLAKQQLSDSVTELSRVRAQRADAEAKALSVKAALENGGAIDTLPAVLASPLVQRLREQEVQLRTQLADLGTTLLPGHPRIKALKSQIADLDRQIHGQVERVLKSLQSEAETARIREQQLEADLKTTKAESAKAAEQQVELDVLQREAAAQRSLLETYLTRYREAASRSNHDYVPVDARVFSRAMTPGQPYYPKKPAIIGAARAVFVSPEGDEAAATAVLVAREVADSGLRVLLLDLNPNGAASKPMLESDSYPGVTNLLSAQAQFTDVIHADLYSDCHVMPFGTADADHAMRAVDRLPIILGSLTTAYDVVVIECGATDTGSIRRLMSDDARLLVSVIDPEDEAVARTAARLEADGYGDLMMVTPAGYTPPHTPLSDRSAA